jgi:hypothetical protein
VTTKALKLFGWVFLLTAFTGCQKEESTGELDPDPVSLNMAFSVTKHEAGVTRMSDAVVQDAGKSAYRGFSLENMICFSVRGEVQKTDRPLGLFTIDNEMKFESGKAEQYGGFYRYDFYNVMQGTASFLVYGKAKNGGTDKAQYGSLVATYPGGKSPSGIHFKPDAIHSGSDKPAEASYLAAYLTSIANTTGWSQTTNSWLKAVYLNFIGQQAEGYAVMAGSTRNVIAYVNALYKAVSEKTFTEAADQTLKDAILTSITAGTTNCTVTFDSSTNKVTALSVNYPADGLPDGAAALMWSKETTSGITEWRFEPQTQTTTLANINTISRYCYPAELYYFTNSTIRTSIVDVNTDENFTNKSLWDGNTGILGLYPDGGGVVTTTTQSAAIVKPLQYAVARLKVSMQSTAAILSDNSGNSVNLTTTPHAFPVTGVIVCNQHPVGFDFKPETYSSSMSTAEDKFVYDTQILNNSSTPASPYYLSTSSQTLPSTLVLQSYDNEKVTIILEFRNDSGVTFHGKNGLVYPGTKFYLIATIDPVGNASGTEDYKKRVFTQDYITTVNMQVKSDGSLKSLANAYNVLPDVLGGRLEVGVMLTPDWIQATPTNIVLE